MLLAVQHRDGALYPIRTRLEELTPERALVIGLVASVLYARAHLGFDTTAMGRAGVWAHRLARVRVEPAVALPIIVALSASLWTVLSAEVTIPRVLGDELIYSGIGKSLALHGSYLLRGDLDVGHSLLYPLIISPVYALAPNGVSAHIAVQTLNAVMFSLTAVPAYFLARRVVPHGLATLVAILTVANPWGGFTAWVMTESAFYLVFALFALALVLALERPTALRQVTVVALIIILAGIRTQAAVIPAAAVAAILVTGLSRRAVRRTVLEQRLLLGSLAGLLVAGAVMLLVASVSAYSALFNSSVSPAAFVRWGAWNSVAVAISAGVAAAATLPAALAELLGRKATPDERAVGAAAASLIAAMIASVALLGASNYGLGLMQERSLFYIAPLVFTCFAFWLRKGAKRRWKLTSITVLGLLGAAAWLPNPPPTQWSAGVALKLVGDPRGVPAAVLLVLVGSAVVLLSRSMFGPVVLTVLVLATVAAVDQSGWNSPIAPSQSKGLAWIDAALPPGTDATIVHVDTVVPSGDACAGAAKDDQQFFVVLSEFLNTHVYQTTYLYHPVGRDYLPARKLELGPDLTLLDRGKPLAARYVVVDSRIPVKGREIARLDLSTLGSDLSHGASLTLWKATQPVRFDFRGPLRLSERPDGQPCA